ncbi:MAG: hypothetical protein KDK36_16125 [Leptospiraceae bacterium]|nr:hypothetical protein [Leptospiraceae bacterium]
MNKNKSYINTDLEIIGDKKLKELHSYFIQKCDVLYSKKVSKNDWRYCLEAKNSGIDSISKVQTDIDNLLNIIENLSKEYKDILKSSRIFIFNIGFSSFKNFRTNEILIPNIFIKRIYKVGASIAITIYPLNETKKA